MSEKIALLGFGDIAKRLVPLVSDEFAVTGVRRSSFSDPNVTAVQADCLDGKAMTTLFAQAFDVVVMSFTPSEMNDEGYQRAYVETVRTVLTALGHALASPRLLLFISSTSVYPQKDGSEVNERSLSEPDSYSGRRILEAEQLLHDSPYASCCVRFSGIYGPGRTSLIKRVMAGVGSPEQPPVFTNRIHSEDCAGVLAHLIRYQRNHTLAPFYIATDHLSATIYDVKQWLAQTMGFAADHLQVSEQAQTRGPRSNKRCSNQLLLDTGYVFRYPTFKEGYAALLAEDTSITSTD